MAVVSLEYNPYILETKIKFNNKEPRFDSLVKRYSNGLLHSWINQIPKIFCDEMNGYDFRLEFSGTKKDYVDLLTVFSKNAIYVDFMDDDATEGYEEAFREIGNNNKRLRPSVRTGYITAEHKKELEERRSTAQKIDELLSWLDNNSNRKFDLETFKDTNGDLYNRSHPFVVINGGTVEGMSFDDLNVSVESIEDINAIIDTEMKDIPILICISHDTVRYLPAVINKLKRNKDIKSSQLFFLLSNNLNEGKIIREISDLGIREPQIVNKERRSEIEDYIILYPLTRFINEAICLIDNEISELSQKIESNGEQFKQSNSDAAGKIELIEEKLNLYNQILEAYESRDKVQCLTSWEKDKEFFEKTVSEWKTNKIKTTDPDSAGKLAKEYQTYLNWRLEMFENKVNQAAKKAASDKKALYAVYYQMSKLDDDLHVDDVELPEIKIPRLQGIAEEMLTIKDELYVEKKDIFDYVYKKDVQGEMVLEVTYYMYKWRNNALNILSPIAAKYIEDYTVALKKYDSALAGKYIEKVKSEIDKNIKYKAELNSQLSEEDKMLQQDIDWYHELKGKLDFIKRG